MPGLGRLLLIVQRGYGQGVPQDYVRAHMWFNLSAAQGNQKAIFDTRVERALAERAIGYSVDVEEWFVVNKKLPPCPDDTASLSSGYSFIHL